MECNKVNSRRIVREKKTIDKMIILYCKKNHGSSSLLCENCNSIREYAFSRLIACPFGEDKPVCNACEVHCYKPEMREKVKVIMRYSGPRMLLRHPYLAVMHLIDKKKKKN